MPSKTISERLDAGDPLLLDGGTGSELQRRGVEVLHGVSAESGLEAWSALANIEAPDVVQQVHQDYLRVGADIITSNNFWTSPTRLQAVGLADRWEDYARAAAENALKARAAGNPEAYIAGGMAAPNLQRKTNTETSDVAIMGARAVRQEFAAHAALLANMGVDALLPEYVGHIADCAAAVAACEQTGLPVFLGIRHIRADATMQYGEQLEDLVAALEGHRVDAILLMCGRPEDTSASLPHLRAVFDGCTGAYCNAGYFPTSPVLSAATEETDREADFLRNSDYYPARMAAFAREWKEMGAQIIGGCCATGPEHVLAMRPVVKGESK